MSRKPEESKKFDPSPSKRKALLPDDPKTASGSNENTGFSWLLNLPEFRMRLHRQLPGASGSLAEEQPLSGLHGRVSRCLTILYIHIQYIYYTHTHTRAHTHTPPLPALSVLSLCRALANRDTLSPCTACSSDQDDRAPGCQHSCGPRGMPWSCVVHWLHGRTSAVP